MALAVITINNLAPAMEKKFQEVERVNKFAQRAIQAIVSAGGLQTSGNILDDGGASVVGSWTYTPQASS
jgi:hypothetical protein